MRLSSQEKIFSFLLTDDLKLWLNWYGGKLIVNRNWVYNMKIWTRGIYWEMPVFNVYEAEM